MYTLTENDESQFGHYQKYIGNCPNLPRTNAFYVRLSDTMHIYVPEYLQSIRMSSTGDENFRFLGPYFAQICCALKLGTAFRPKDASIPHNRQFRHCQIVFKVGSIIATEPL